MGAAISVGKGLLQAGMAQSEAEAIRNQAKFEQQQLGFNKKLAEINAEDALTRGEEKVKDFEKEAARFKGSQLAALAAQGIAIDEGMAAAVQYQTDKQIDTDIKRIRNNAWRESWGFKVEALGISGQSRLLGLAAESKATSTILAGGLEAVESFTKAGASFASGGASSGGGG